MSHAARKWASGIPTCAPNIEVVDPASAVRVAPSSSERPARYSPSAITASMRSSRRSPLHPPLSNARRAARTASSICASDNVSTSAMTSSVYGFSTARGSPSPVTNRPSTYDCRMSAIFDDICSPDDNEWPTRRENGSLG